MNIDGRTVMGKPRISDNRKWMAVLSCDKSYDGKFFYGVKTTGIFCRPSCNAKAPMRENVVFFGSRECAENAGFRPCKKCRPDKESYQPDLELLERIRSAFAADYAQPIDIGQTAKQAGVSLSHLTRLFRRHCGTTPAQYVAGLRVDKAAELLRGTDTGILEIAYMTGFRSLSAFYKCFKEQTGQTPKEYRSMGGK
jgi:AraC family transcriptional regulator of adaptative response / methylphosphotriester-DNA alkyltransferase methyltransferase